MDLRRGFPRSMRVRLEGYVHLARMIDKCRAVLAGTKGEYIYPCPMDDRLMEFAGITAEQFTTVVKSNQTDDGVAQWFRHTAKPRNQAELDEWNRMMLNRGPTRRKNRPLSTNIGMPSILREGTSPAGPICRTLKKGGPCPAEDNSPTGFSSESIRDPKLLLQQEPRILEAAQTPEIAVWSKKPSPSFVVREASFVLRPKKNPMAYSS